MYIPLFTMGPRFTVGDTVTLTGCRKPENNGAHVVAAYIFDANGVCIFEQHIDEHKVPHVSLAKEKPCGGCGRNNDIGIKVCWCCGGNPE